MSIASIERKRPAILSPTNRSRSALVRPMPGIKVIMLPIKTLSISVIKPGTSAHRASPVTKKVEMNLIKIYLLHYILTFLNKIM